MSDGEGALNTEQLERLARYSDEKVMSAKNYKTSEGEISYPTERGAGNRIRPCARYRPHRPHRARLAPTSM
jgi:hypothetical protein